jgi:hypothetical protein
MLRSFFGVLIGLGVSGALYAGPAQRAHAVTRLDGASMVAAVGGACSGCATRACSYHDKKCGGGSKVESKPGSFFFCDTDLTTGCKLSNPGLCYTTYWLCNADCSKCDYNDVYKTKSCTID